MITSGPAQAHPAATTPDLLLLLSQASHVLTTELTAGLAELGLSPRAFCVLSKVAARHPSSNDRRARIISVTPEGEQLVAEAQCIVARIYGDVLAALPPGECEAFVNGLTRLACVGGRLSTPVPCDRPPRRRPLRGTVAGPP